MIKWDNPENFAKQLRMTEAKWRTLQQHGVTERTRLLVDLSFIAPTHEAAISLASSLKEKLEDTPSVQEAHRAYWVEGQAPALTFSLESLQSLVREMCVLGSQHQCVFDGWSAKSPQI
jgi:hypothetical protein